MMHPNTLLADYMALLKQYNEHTNIYSKSSYDKLEFHLQDSINIAAIVSLSGETVVDLGSGSGLPSAIIAIMNSDQRVIAIESKERKRRFLHQVKSELALENYEVFEGDIQQFRHQRNDFCGAITAKAFAKAPKALQIAKTLNGKKGKLVIPISDKQLSDLPKAITRFADTQTIDNTEYHYIIHPL